MPSIPGDLARVHIRVQGRVQGVGFRAYVEFCAENIGVKGWVRNVGWDRVEAVAEGSREEAERFVEKVKEGPRSSRVDEAGVEWGEASGEFDTFSVRGSV